MPWQYVVKVKLKPRKQSENDELFLKKVLDNLYADYKIMHIERNGDFIIVTYTFSAGAKINSHYSGYNFKFPDSFLDLQIEEIASLEIKMPNYLAYLAKKQKLGEKPLTYEEFWEAVNKGNYWENL